MTPPRAIEITFEGRVITARKGESIAAALTRSGIHHLRTTPSGEARGIFCGMGVCQDCLVEVDGRGGQRACVSKITAPINIRRQAPRMALTAQTDMPTHAQEILNPDILVIGGGPAGLNAALAACRCGASVVLVDERPNDGGQFYKQPAVETAVVDDTQFAAGRALIASVAASSVDWRKGAQVWGIFDPLQIMFTHGGNSVRCAPRKVIVATGAYERPIPVPGWTLPGVMTTGAAQTLLRSYGVPAAKRVLVAGNGPLNFQVALELARAGVEIMGVAELSPKPDWASLSSLLAMTANAPQLMFKGAAMMAGLKARSIPVHYGHVLKSVRQAGGGLVASLGRIADRQGGHPSEIEADVVCMGYGFLPANELLKAVGCTHTKDSRGHPVTVRDSDCRTSVPAVFAAGDCAGMGGAPAAEAEGRIAGATAASELGYAADPALLNEARRTLGRHRRFQRALWTIFDADPPRLDHAEVETVICRCEELKRSDLADVLESGVGTLNAVKRATRLGMGRCQGRYCAAILDRQFKGADQSFSARPPTRPIRISDIA